MNAEPDLPREAPESGRPAPSDDALTRSSTGVPGERAGADDASGADAHPDDELFEELRELGWTGTPFVVHGNVVLGNTEMYEAAERMGVASDVPRIALTEVYEEAGLDVEALDEGWDANDPDRALFEDWLRELPRHLRDKYGL